MDDRAHADETSNLIAALDRGHGPEPARDAAYIPRDVKRLREVDSMDGYLSNYGEILGKKAIDALMPLHLPGRDARPDFDDMLRDPFPCQQHVIAGAVRMLNAVGSGFICGEMGCIAGESEVHDPVADLYRRVDRITRPFHVVSHHEGRAVIGEALVPFIKGGGTSSGSPCRTDADPPRRATIAS